eukprot:Tbor_TRINITY_DN4369_c0_g1::TRINITY_DN4369_c0_g1_i1::g.7685::m.7685/K07023/K07023; putative hydrolases of HD superfamily
MDETIKFLNTLADLKDVRRTGWVEHGIPNAESVAAHMYRMSVLCMMCPDTSLDKNRMIRMALCHDMPEAIVGDISPAMKVSKEDKYRREEDALNTMMDPLPGDVDRDAMKALWHEYEAQETPEAIFMKDMDLLEMVMQASKYEHMYPDKALDSFFESGAKIKHPWATGIYNRLLSTRPNK